MSVNLISCQIFLFKLSETLSAPASSHPAHPPTSPTLSPDTAIPVLTAAQSEVVLLRKQLDDLRRTNRLYEQQLRNQDSAGRMRQSTISNSTVVGQGSPLAGSRSGRRHSGLSDSLSRSPTAGSVISERRSPFREEDLAFGESLERENRELHHRVERLEDEVVVLSREKDSLLQTLQLMQEELIASENKQRTRTK